MTSGRGVVICVITFRRPRQLQRVLEGIGQLEISRIDPRVETLVVDNDADRSAEPVCKQARRTLPWPLRYEVEPRQGIPFARNKAVSCAQDGADFIAFIDDDGYPSPLWLEELLHVQDRFAADVVTGPQVRYVSEDAPRWLRCSGLLDTRRYPTGHRMDCAYTGNVLVRPEVFRQMKPVFDERFGLSGGSDVHFFRRVHLAGYSIVWADQAVVKEWMPANRGTTKQNLLRAYSIGNSTSLLEVELNRSLGTRLTVLSRALVYAAKAFVLLPLGLLVGKRGFVRALWHLYRAAGMLTGLVGHRFTFYRSHG